MNNLSKVYKNCQNFTSIVFILDKINQDGNFLKLDQCFQTILQSEMKFTLSQIYNVVSKNDLAYSESELTNNTYMFKENLKLIKMSLIDTF